MAYSELEIGDKLASSTIPSTLLIATSQPAGSLSTDPLP